MSALDHRLMFLFTNASETEIAVTVRKDALDLLGHRLPNHIGSKIFVLGHGQALKLSLPPGCLLQLYVRSKPGVINLIEPALLPASLAVTRAKLSTCEATATSVAESTVATIGSFYSPTGLPVHASVVTQLGKLRVGPDLIFDTLEVETLTDIHTWDEAWID